MVCRKVHVALPIWAVSGGQGSGLGGCCPCAGWEVDASAAEAAAAPAAATMPAAAAAFKLLLLLLLVLLLALAPALLPVWSRWWPLSVMRWNMEIMDCAPEQALQSLGGGKGGGAALPACSPLALPPEAPAAGAAPPMPIPGFKVCLLKLWGPAWPSLALVEQKLLDGLSLVSRTGTPPT